MKRSCDLLFDLDGTLVDSAQGIAAALTALSIARGGAAIDVRQVRPLVSHGVEALVRETLGPLSIEPVADVAAFRALLRDVRADPAAIYPGVIAALEYLAQAGHTMAVVTNKPERLSRSLLDQLDLTRFFGAIVGGDTLPVAKPDPAPLHFALQAIGATGTSAVLIGDSAVDARAAQAAGIPFILFDGGYDAAGCEGLPIAAAFAQFAGLPALLAGIAPDALALASRNDA